MAEGVQGVMEDMLADLLNLLENKVFTQEEVDEIVRKRKDFEYKLARRSPPKRHFLKAIQYELSIESLRASRKIDLQITRPFASDHCSMLLFSPAAHHQSIPQTSTALPRRPP
jgi:U3 small nucleolar RNA-associated protein 6